MDKEQFKALFTHLFYRIFYARGSGLKYAKRDKRNFNTANIGWGIGYTPKHDIKIIPTLSVKNQSPFNTCVWNAATIQKEVDENVILSPRSIVTKGKQLGYVARDGFANMVSSQKVLNSWGIEEDVDCPDEPKGTWDKYSSVSLNNDQAGKHRSKTYWEVDSREPKMKALDEDHIIATALDWYTGYNGTYLPKDGVLRKIVGYYVGGHSVAIIGYIRKYKGIDGKTLLTGEGGTEVYVLQNSYGESWGKTFIHNGAEYKGCFFVDVSWFESQDKYGSYCNLDIDIDTGDFINQYAQKNVKVVGEPAIYHISMGKKRVYPNMATFICFVSGDLNNFSLLTEYNEIETFKKLPDGEPMNIEVSDLFKKNKDTLKELDERNLLPRILDIINKK